MGYEEVFSSEILEVIHGVSFSVLAAFLVGILGVLFICVAIGFARSKETGGESGRESDITEPEEPNSKSDGVSKQNPRSKGNRFKQQASTKKLALPPHALLAAEFKGHTGAVLSLDFDTNGKYLASSSDGELAGFYLGELLWEEGGRENCHMFL